jgi:hypothetical protein
VQTGFHFAAGSGTIGAQSRGPPEHDMVRSTAQTVDAWLAELPPERREAIAMTPVGAFIAICELAPEKARSS